MVLVENELIKLFKKKSSWIMWLILLGVQLLFGKIYSFSLSNNPSDVELLNETNLSFISGNNLTFLATIFIVVVASSIVAEEFSKGTIKFLLIRPYTRREIMAAKFCTVIIYGILTFIILIITSFISLSIFVHVPNLSSTLNSYQNQTVFIVMIKTICTSFVSNMLIITVAFLISAAIRSQSLAVGVGMGIYFVNSIASGLLMLATQKYHWLKFNPLNMMNLGNQLSETSLKPYRTFVAYSLSYWQMFAGLIIYIIIFYILADWIFEKRDVALS